MQIKGYKEPKKKWLFEERTDKDETSISELAEALDVSRITAGLIYDRVGKDDIDVARDFIGDCANFHDPLCMCDMHRACERIEYAIENDKKMLVYGDYDVDGVTSVATLVTYLRRRGVTSVEYCIPCRLTEGYGLNRDTLERLGETGVEFMITVDTGITAIDEIDHATSLGIETVVTDHHEYLKDENGGMKLPSVPCVDPRREDRNYPFDELAGVGVVFKLICALEMRRTGGSVDEVSRSVLDEYGELVAIGTVADVMPLVDENRAIVKAGLELMRDPRFIGTRELISVCAGIDLEKKPVKKLATSLISFTLAPRINAVGRMDDASRAVELFICEDSERAAEMALELCEMNALRQKEENKILCEAVEKLEQSEDNDSVIVLDDDEWHHGVIGIVASRMTERYGLPSILISFAGSVKDAPSDTDIGKGSGRSVKGLDLVKALEACRGTLVRFGGHELAAGLTLERGHLEEFKRAVNEHASELFNANERVKILRADAKAQLRELDLKLANELYMLEPYGQSNPVPCFMISALEVKEIYPLKEGKHIKLILSDGKNSVTALFFGMKYSEFEFSRGETVDVLATLELNEYMGRTSVQLHIKDMRASDAAETVLEREQSIYVKAKDGGGFPAKMLPRREDFAAVYRYLKSTDDLCEDMRYSHILSQAQRLLAGKSDENGLSYIKLRAILDIMSELALIEYTPCDAESCRVRVNRQSTKVDLESSRLLCELRRNAR